MNIILLSGGSGKRLWPLSNDARSKQFLKLLVNEQGGYESMIQRVYRQIKDAGINAHIVVATGNSQVDSIKGQLGHGVEIVVEPERRDTFPAVALAAAYLSLQKLLSDEEIITVLPIDPYVDIDYFTTLLNMEQVVQSGFADMVLMGIKPTYPSEKYGYIVSEKESKNLLNGVCAYPIKQFKEKPSLKMAKELFREGAFWNGGVFVFKLGYIMGLVKKYRDTSSFDDLRAHYRDLKKISFDYEVLEKATSIAMISFSGRWKDLGTWNTLSEEIKEPCIGNAVIGEDAENTTVINETNLPVVVLGTKNIIVAASPDGILVSDKQKSSYLKPYVEKINDRPMFEERRWGEYRVLDYIEYENGEKSLTKHLTLDKGKHIGYQKHIKRNEIWIVVDGSGDMVLDGQVYKIGRGDTVYINKGQAHALRPDTVLHIIEVQIGRELEETDREEVQWIW